MHFNKNIEIRLFEFVFIRSWYVVVFLLLCYIGYDLGVKKHNKTLFEMKCKHEKLLREKIYIAKKKQELNIKLRSQSDHAFIEMMLMKELGVVPENQIKVHFK